MRGRRLADRLRAARNACSTLLALVLVAFVVVRGSQAAFTAEVRNEGNSFVAGNVELVDGAAGALFEVRDLAPGGSATRCITVTYRGTSREPGTVRVYGGGYLEQPGPRPRSEGLGRHLRLTVEEGDGEAGTDGSCRRFERAATIVDALALPDFNRVHADVATGAGSWTPTPMASRAYRLTVTLDPAAPDAEQLAGVADVSFAWELSSGVHR